MIGRALDIPTPDGTMDGYAAYPDGGGRFALVVLFMDVWGLREELFAIARRVAAHGYYCVVPNLFYREGKVRYERRNADGKMVSFDTLPVALQEEIRSHARALNRKTAYMDIAAILDFCRGEPVDDGPGGIGRLLFGRPDSLPCRAGVSAAVSRHRQPARHAAGDRRGEFAASLRPSHARRGLLWLCEHDRFSAPEMLAALERALAGHADLAYRFNLHAGAHHGYALPDRDVHDRAAAEADWRDIFDMFERQLAPSAHAGSGT